jgi:signal transduction histidine kinase
VLEGDGLVVRATLSSAGEVALERTPLSASRALPRSVIERVFRSGEGVLLGDAAHEGPFVADPYVAEHGVRSLLVVPIRRAARPIGVLYFENNLAAFAFAGDRARLLDVLSAQIAISLENARLYHEAQESIRARDEFLTAASHELRTPVMSLLLGAQGLLASEAAPPERRRRMIELLARQAKRLDKLVDDVMSVGKIHLGRLDLRLTEVDLVAVARDVTERLAYAAAQAGCAVELHAPGAVRGLWDRDRLDQVVTNLLANAVKFGASEPIDVSVHQAPGLARLEVVDHGIGIQPEALPRIFEKFERATAANAYGGLGLGLYLARNIVEAMGGTLRAESAPGRETRFTVELPTGLG